MKLLKTLLLVLLLPILSFGQTTIFSENCGTGATGNPSVSAYTGFQNYGTLIFSGNADVRTTTASTSYSGASGGNNIFITNTLNTNVTISNISTTNYTNLSLSFGHLKTTSSSNGSELFIEVSTDGTTWTSLSYSVPTGSGTANIWRLITPTGSIPSTSNLRIRFRMCTVVTGLQFRIDDIKLVGCLVPTTPTSLNVTYTSPACSTSTISLPASTFLQNTSTGTSTSISTSVTSTSTFYARTQSIVSGCSSVWSNAYGPFTVTIKTPPTINTSPVNVSCYVGDNISFVSSSSYSYVWQISTDGGTTWNNLTIASPYSVSGDTLKVTNTQLTMSGYLYRILSSNTPCTNQPSTSALLTVDAVLPITLIDFNVSLQGDNNLITWVTATEINNWKFVVERSSDINSWKVIAEVPGSGNSNINRTYNYLDKSPQNGVNYYRLTQVDYDGKSETFKIVAINRDNKQNDITYYDMQQMIMGNPVIVSNPEYNKVYLKSSNGKMEKVVFIK
jgi:hypothetical protein